ncbi:MAG: DUF3325 domain-containing protein [Pseudomonas sp.]|jgi:hypothetical protein|uniref:DUF3325 domain-containing protein n=1 Tax=Ectopseudomonas mendocina TaxID=300 RepID=UPI003133196E
MITLVGAAALAYSSMVGLCQGLKKHQLAVWGRPVAAHWYRVLRLYGWLAIALSLWLSAQYWGWAIGSVGEFGLLSAAGWLLVLGMPYWPRTLVMLGMAAGLLGLAVFFHSLW